MSKVWEFLVGMFEWLALIVMFIGGVLNVVKLIEGVGVFGALEIMRVLGVLYFPLGAVMGFVR